MRRAAIVVVFFALACGASRLPDDLGVGDLSFSDGSMMSTGQDGPCWAAHLCVKTSCCDPSCQGIADGQSCVNIGPGYYCAFLTSNCTCALDGAWHCHPAPSDMAYSDMTILRDVLQASD
jgi:hypothetical protein